MPVGFLILISSLAAWSACKLWSRLNRPLTQPSSLLLPFRLQLHSPQSLPQTGYQQEIRMIHLAFPDSLYPKCTFPTTQLPSCSICSFFSFNFSWYCHPYKGIQSQILQLFGMSFGHIAHPRVLRTGFKTGRQIKAVSANAADLHIVPWAKKISVCHKKIYMKLGFLP